jgi:hypothetical protein
MKSTCLISVGCACDATIWGNVVEMGNPSKMNAAVLEQFGRPSRISRMGNHAELWAARIRALAGPESIYSGKADGRAESFVGLEGVVDRALRRLKVDERHNIVK